MMIESLANLAKVVVLISKSLFFRIMIRKPNIGIASIGANESKTCWAL